jgi:hypothetical protein
MNGVHKNYTFFVNVMLATFLPSANTQQDTDGDGFVVCTHIKFCGDGFWQKQSAQTNSLNFDLAKPGVIKL